MFEINYLLTYLLNCSRNAGKGDIEEVVWLPREEQLPDCLMKRGASPVKMLQVIENGKL